MRDQNPVIGNRYLLVLGTFDPIFHLPLIQHTAAAVHNQLITGEIFRNSTPEVK